MVSCMQVTPSRFVHNMRQKCIETPQRIVLPEAHDHRIIEAASAAQSKGIADIILLGNEEIIQQVLTLCLSLCQRLPRHHSTPIVG